MMVASRIPKLLLLLSRRIMLSRMWKQLLNKIVRFYPVYQNLHYVIQGGVISAVSARHSKDVSVMMHRSA